MRILFVEFFVFPMPVLWLLLLALLVWNRQRASRRLFILGTVLFALASLPTTGKLLLWGLASGAPPLEGADERTFAAIVVPTAGVFDDGTGRWWPTQNSIRRAASGRALQQQLEIPLILSGGSPIPGQPPEASTVASMLGIAGRETLLETTARNSSESGAAVAALLAEAQTRRVVLVTHASHVMRMSAALRHQGLAVVAAPVGRPPETLAPAAWGIMDLVPSNSGLKLTRGALWEYAGIVWYLATGRLDFDDLWPSAA